MIQNEQFWSYWREGKFDEALKCQLNSEPKRRGAGLFNATGRACAVNSGA